MSSHLGPRHRQEPYGSFAIIFNLSWLKLYQMSKSRFDKVKNWRYFNEQGVVFERVIREVCEASQVDFEEGGVDQQTLEEMRQVSSMFFDFSSLTDQVVIKSRETVSGFLFDLWWTPLCSEIYLVYQFEMCLLRDQPRFVTAAGGFRGLWGNPSAAPGDTAFWVIL
jgi:hypothetical protein